MTESPADISSLLVPGDGPDWTFHQALVLAWDGATGVGTIRMLGAEYEKVPILNGMEGFSLSEGDVVAVGWYTSQPFILGRVVVPNDPARQDLKFVIYSDAGLTVKGGGSITVEDGGAIIARYDNGNPAVFYGSLVESISGDSAGHGLLVQGRGTPGDQGGDIFRAKREEDGTHKVVIGQSGGTGQDRIDDMSAYSQSIDLDSADQAVLRGRNDAFLQSDGTTWVGVHSQSVFLQGGASTSLSVGPQDILFNSEDTIFIDCEDEIQLNAGNDRVFVAHQTTTNAANCEITTSGLIRRSTSARRFKVDIADLDVDPNQVLNLRPRTWRDAAEVEQDPATEHRVPGFVAEEVLDAGLGEFVSYDADGRPESIAYDRLTAALIPLLRQQQAQIEHLTARVEALEANR